MIISSAADFREVARRRLPRFLYDYADGGAYAEETMRRNVSDLAGIALRQRILQDVATIDTKTTFFGREVALPVALGPVGISGILSGVMLSVARITGETAPLLFTAFGNPYLSVNVGKPMQSLPLLIFNYATSPYNDWHDLAWGASLILLLWVLFLNIFTKLITRKWKVQL